jgi:hypothetical protein
MTSPAPIPASLQNLISLVDNSSDFRNNSLYTLDNDLRLFLNAKQIGGDWESFQILAPSATERQALIDLYNSTDGDNWTDNSGWKEPPLDVDGFAMPGTEGSWFGVLLNGGGALERIELDNNNLSGAIPASIGDLSNLQYLMLWHNQLTGSIPAELGGLSNLGWLLLSGNRLTGSIPVELGNLSNLVQLNLDDNQLTGTIPPELGNMANLGFLNLDGNALTGNIPPELGNLTNLVNLSLGENQLTGSIPPELGYLTNLVGLWLGGCRFSGAIPPELGNLVNLDYLRLNSNDFTGPIPSSLQNLTSLEDNGSDFRWNANYTEEDAVRLFLNSKQIDGDWESFQTIAPENLVVTDVGIGDVSLSWDPITYNSGNGGYIVEYSKQPAGPWTVGNMTSDKSATSLTQDGLDPYQSYYFRVNTLSNAHVANSNDVYSDYSDIVSNLTQCVTGAYVAWTDAFNGGPGEPWIAIDMGDNSNTAFVNDQYEMVTENISLADDKYLISYVPGCADDAVIEARIREINPGDMFVAGVILRGDPVSDSAYGACFSSIGNLHIVKKINGADTEILASLLNVPGVDTADFQLKFAVTGSALSAKVWTTGTLEPETWDLETADTDLPFGHGGIFLSTGSSEPGFPYFSPAQAAFDDVTMTTDVNNTMPDFSPVYRPGVYPVNMYYAYNDSEFMYMSVGAIIDSPDYNVWLENIPSAGGPLQISRLPKWDEYYPYAYGGALLTSQGFPPPWDAYEDMEYIYYIDVNGDQVHDSWEPSDSFTMPAGTYKNLGFVKNVKVSDSDHPTITWDGIDQYSDLIYQVRIVSLLSGDTRPDTRELLFSSPVISEDPSNSYSYTYTGDLFNEHPTLAIVIEASEISDGRILNRSRYFVNYPEPAFDPVNKTFLCANHEYYAIDDSEDTFMLGGPIVDTPVYNVLVDNIPTSTDSYQLFRLPGWYDFYPYVYGVGFRTADGFPAAGPAYEGIAYTFYIDINSNRTYDIDEPADVFTIAPGSIIDLPAVENVNITGSEHPTIFWNGLDQFSGLTYRVRIFPLLQDNKPNTGDLLFESAIIAEDVSNLYAYTYNGNLFNEYETLAIAVEALQDIDGRLTNRSRYFVNHSETSGQTQEWVKVSDKGFGNENNFGIIPTHPFNGYFYAGTVNEADGGALWRSPDGITWEQVLAGGFGDADNIDILPLAVFNGYLYAGTDNEISGGELWRSADGENLVQVTAGGFGDSNNELIVPRLVSGAYLYAGTDNDITGGEIWRSTNGITWEQVNTDGFGDKNNAECHPMTVFNGHIYAGTKNETTGAQLWRSADGLNWEQVGDDADGIAILSANIFDNYLYIALENRETGGQIWRSPDGNNWTQVVSDGFGNNNNENINFAFIPVDGYLYAGTWNYTSGAEIWRSADGMHWEQDNINGFGNPQNSGISAITLFEDYFYAGTFRWDTGGEIWRKKVIYPIRLTVSWSTATQTVLESAGTAAITAELNVISDVNVTVPYTVGGTASNGVDHSLAAGTITIPAGNLRKSKIFNIFDDNNDEPNETIIVSMGIPTNADTGQITVHTITITDNDEPPNVLIPRINIEKATNGMDADTAPGPEITVGSSVVWTYQVTNTGDTLLANIQVTDNNGTPGNTQDDFAPAYVSGDNGDGILQAGESWQYRAEGIAGPGQYANIATAFGTFDNDEVTDTDASHYYGIAIESHTVAFTAGFGGTISGVTSQTVNHGEDCTPVRAVADAGYEFTHWTGDYEGTDNPLTIKNVTTEISVSAGFSPKTYEVVYSSASGGNVDGQTSQTVGYGSDALTVTAMPSDGYHFMNWTDASGAIVGTDASITVSAVTSDQVLIANFEINTYVVSFTAGSGGSLSDDTPQNVAHGGDCLPVAAIPDEGYSFSGWTGDVSDTSNPLTIKGVTSDMSVIATFGTNLPADRPVLIGPKNGNPTDAPIYLVAGNFSDAEGDAHVGSRWQVRLAGETDWFYDVYSTSDLTRHTVNLSDGTPDEDLFSSGLEYEWRVGYMDDGSNQTKWSGVGHFIYGTIENDPNLPPVIPGFDQKDYRMISFVQYMNEDFLENLLSEQGFLDNDDPVNDFKIGSYDPTVSGGSYVEFPDVRMEPGRACWFWVRRGIKADSEGVYVPVDRAYNYCLKYNKANGNGWNMIGVPNEANYKWGDVEIIVYDASGNIIFGPRPVSKLSEDNPYIDVHIHSWDQGAYLSHSADFMMQPYEGYWVKSKTSDVCLVYKPSAQVDEADTSLISKLFETTREWAGEWIGGWLPSPDYAFAENDSPPMPMSLDNGDNGVKKSYDTDSSSCFIRIISNSK